MNISLLVGPVERNATQPQYGSERVMDFFWLRRLSLFVYEFVHFPSVNQDKQPCFKLDKCILDCIQRVLIWLGVDIVFPKLYVSLRTCRYLCDMFLIPVSL